MAKGSRSKTRKFWASERRRLLGVPVERKQLEEQAQKLQENLQRQNSQPSILKLKSIFRRPERAVQRTLPPKKPERQTKSEPMVEANLHTEEEESDHGAGADMEIDGKLRPRKNRPVSRFKKSGRPFAAKKQKRIKS